MNTSPAGTVLRVGLDVAPLTKRAGTGTATYVEGLLEGFRAIEGLELTPCRRFGRPIARDLPTGVRTRRYLRRGALGDRLNPWLMRGLDLFHHTRNRVDCLPGLPSVYTCQDVWDLASDRPDRAKVRAKYERILALRPWVAAISRFTANELVRWTGFPEDRIRVTPLAVASCFRLPEDAGRVDAALDRLGIPRPYVLYVGLLLGRKNVDRIGRAFGLAVRRRDLPHSLVVAGRGDPPPGLAELGDRLIRPGYVDAGILPALYAGAEAFLWPSLYEGFGLPILEAMACACPVVTSAGNACGEVAGDAALRVDPEDTGAIAEALETVLTDADVAARLRRAGPARAAEFSWTACAQATAGLYWTAVDEVRGQGRPVRP